MANLTKNTPRNYELGETNELPVIADHIIYEGSAVGDDGNGNMQQLAAGDPFCGFADAQANNKDGAAGAKKVRLRERGCIELSVTGVTGIGDHRKAVYASDGATFTLTESTNSFIGRIKRHISGTKVLVAFDARKPNLATLAELTGTTGGAANGALEDVSTAVTGVDGTGSNAASKADVDARLAAIANNFEEFKTQLNKLLRMAE